jgi:hypothetical protein
MDAWTTSVEEPRQPANKHTRALQPAGNKLLGPRLLAAVTASGSRSCCGLRLVVNDGDGEENAPEASAEASKVIIMEVVPRRPPAAAAASAPPPLDR